jgi:hypothetical protein
MHCKDKQEHKDHKIIMIEYIRVYKIYFYKNFLRIAEFSNSTAFCFTYLELSVAVIKKLHNLYTIDYISL